MQGKKILIIGGTGALGKMLLNRYHDNNQLFILSRDEHKHVNLMNQYKNVEFEIGDIRRKDSIISAINKFRPEVFINASAIKHIHICEANPYESIQTNVLGNQNIIDAIQQAKHQIEGIIFTSTDKACKPINVYGMCKSISERMYQNFAKHNKDIKVAIVRYGNVLESTGSVIPFFKKIITGYKFDGGYMNDVSGFIPITHPEMTRFFLTLEDAITLLIEWAYENPESHGYVAIPKTPSLRIIDLAITLIKWYRKPNIEIKYVGIRPGEKIHEELISTEESLRTRKYDNYYLITDKLQTDTPWFYTSANSLIEGDKNIEKFLIKSGVLK